MKCPKLRDDCTCGVYEQRYGGDNASMRLVVVGTFKSRALKNLDGTPAERPFVCGRIEDILKAGALPQEVIDGCAYAHPELLERA